MSSDDDDSVLASVDDEFEEDSDDDVEQGGRLAKIINAQRAIGRKVALQQGVEEELHELGVDSDDNKDPGWGARKALYYGDAEVDVDFDSDDELAAEEAEEAERLQREHLQKYKDADFGLDELSSDEGEDVEEGRDDGEDAGGDSDEEAPAPGDDGTLGHEALVTGRVRVERVQPQDSQLITEQQKQAVLRDAPELQQLLTELKDSLQQVRGRTGPLLTQLRQGGVDSTAGLSFLEAKHMLLFTYSLNILFYLLLKLEGKSVKDHPVLERLVVTKTWLEKARPVERRLRHQIDKLLRTAAAADKAGEGEAPAGNSMAGDPMSARPNPDALEPVVDEDAEARGVYRPPKLTAVAMDEPAEERAQRKAERAKRNVLRQAAQSEMVRELEEEVKGVPAELRLGADAMVGTGVDALKARLRDEARQRAEEDLMMRVPLTKEERKARKAERRAMLSSARVLDDFADDVAGVLAPDAAEAPYFDKLKLAQKYAADVSREPQAMQSADAELPLKPKLQERRAKYDAVKARQAQQLAEEAAAQPKRVRVEDEFYSEVKSQKEARKKAKQDSKRHPELPPPKPDEHALGPRRINTAIEKNRGLTPHRRKSIKNPRKHAQEKFTRAEKRRKGQVRGVRTSAGPYGGEDTGINPTVSRSVRL